MEISFKCAALKKKPKREHMKRCKSEAELVTRQRESVDDIYVARIGACDKVPPVCDICSCSAKV